MKDSDIEMVKDTVSMDDLARYYGFSVRRGFITCPFHGEKTGSLKVYSGRGGWHCFGCGLGGDIIDFAMKYEAVDFTTAVKRVAGYFSIPISDDYSFSAEDRRRIEQKKNERIKAEQVKKHRVDEMITLSDKIHFYEYLMEHVVPLGNAFCGLSDALMASKEEWNVLYESDRG